MAALIEEAFGKDHPDLYTLLGLKTVATSTQIKKAYHKKALEWHPDKNKASDAKVKFQAIGEVHRILSDVELRADYDESGSIPGEHVFKVTKQDILNFAETYIGSPQERADVLKSYVDGQGDLGFVIDHIMLSTEADLERFETMIFDAIAAGEVEHLPGLDRSKSNSAQAAKRRKKAQREAKEAQKEVPSDLLAGIQARQQGRTSFLAQLEEKYCPPNGMKRPAAKRKRP